eukprot:9123432-Pyramimonas_sp.AAC.1
MGPERRALPDRAGLLAKRQDPPIAVLGLRWHRSPTGLRWHALCERALPPAEVPLRKGLYFRAGKLAARRFAGGSGSGLGSGGGIPLFWGPSTSGPCPTCAPCAP